MENLKKVDTKDIVSVNLDGVEIIGVEKDNYSLISIKFKTKSGQLFQISRDTSYSSYIALFIEEAKQEIKKYTVIGTLQNKLINVSQKFNTEKEADDCIEKAKQIDDTAELEKREIIELV